MDPFETLNKQLKAITSRKLPANEITDEDKKIHQLFTCPLGEEVLDIFRKLWVDRALFNPRSVEITVYNVGQADCINFITDSIRRVKGVDR